MQTFVRKLIESEKYKSVDNAHIVQIQEQRSILVEDISQDKKNEEEEEQEEPEEEEKQQQDLRTAHNARPNDASNEITRISSTMSDQTESDNEIEIPNTHHTTTTNEAGGGIPLLSPLLRMNHHHHHHHQSLNQYQDLGHNKELRNQN